MSEGYKDEELLTMITPMTKKEKQQNLYVFQQLADEIANISANYKDSNNIDIKTDLIILKQLFEDNLAESSIDDKQNEKKKERTEITPAALYGGVRKSKYNVFPIKIKSLYCINPTTTT